MARNAAHPIDRSSQSPAPPESGQLPPERLEAAQCQPRQFQLDPQHAWRSVLARDAAADGRFVYAVETTGIFCRPSCASRKPAERNVRFFADPDAAIRAGYRACRRCQPAGAHAEARTVTDLCASIEANLDRMVTLKELGERAGLSPFTVQRMFERVLGISPRQYQIEMRAQKLRETLAPNGGSAANGHIADAIYASGYTASSRMYGSAATTLGMPPGTYKRGAPGESIAFAIAKCPLGLLLAATTEHGVCQVALGDNPAELEAALRARFPRADIHPARTISGTPHLECAINVLLSTMTEHPSALDLPLDLRATAFQQRVWQALRAIPRGETRSYSQLSAELGTPNAVRAVAQACARNPLALLIPCHRVVGRDGSLTGYRWGTERKRRLLELERQGGA